MKFIKENWDCLVIFLVLVIGLIYGSSDKF